MKSPSQVLIAELINAHNPASQSLAQWLSDELHRIQKTRDALWCVSDKERQDKAFYEKQMEGHRVARGKIQSECKHWVSIENVCEICQAYTGDE